MSSQAALSATDPTGNSMTGVVGPRARHFGQIGRADNTDCARCSRTPSGCTASGSGHSGRSAPPAGRPVRPRPPVRYRRFRKTKRAPVAEPGLHVAGVVAAGVVRLEVGGRRRAVLVEDLPQRFERFEHARPGSADRLAIVGHAATARAPPARPSPGRRATDSRRSNSREHR